MGRKPVTFEATFAGKAGELRAYVAHPQDEEAPFPGVIVIQEWWGLNDHVRDIARRFAAQGYFAVAPDLYSRLGHKVAQDPSTAAQLMQALKKPEGVEDLLSTLAWLRARPEVDAGRIATVGFCMGGSYALLLACSTKELKAAAPFYGEVPADDKLRELSCPVFYVYGDRDGWITRRDVDRLSAALKKFGKPGEVRIYPGAQHGFFNDTRKEAYDAAAAKDAFARVLKFFATNLRS